MLRRTVLITRPPLSPQELVEGILARDAAGGCFGGGFGGGAPPAAAPSARSLPSASASSVSTATAATGAAGGGGDAADPAEPPSPSASSSAASTLASRRPAAGGTAAASSLLTADERQGLPQALSDLDAFVEASGKLRLHAAALMGASSAQREENQRLLSENAELRDTLSFFEELVSADGEDGGSGGLGVAGSSSAEFGFAGGGALVGASSGVYDGGGRGLTREGSGGGRELHTANRAVLMELLSLRQARCCVVLC